MLRTDIWGMLPALTTATETYEAAFRWGPAGLGRITGGVIDSGTIDAGNTPTWELRPGLVLGQKTTGNWTHYSPTATDGSEVAAGILLTSLRMQDLQGTNQNKFYGILIGGPVQAGKLLGLDNMARGQMSDRFWFDDPPNIPGAHWFPWRRFQSKTANYTVLAADNFTAFNTLGAAGAVTFTLPAIGPGLYFGFFNQVDQNMVVASAEGTNIVAFNNAAASSVAFQTGGGKIGGAFEVFSNPAGTKWIVVNASAGANTVTVA